MNTKKECAKIVRAYHAGDNDAVNGKPFRAHEFPKDCRKAYKNGFTSGQRHRKCTKKNEKS